MSYYNVKKKDLFWVFLDIEEIRDNANENKIEEREGGKKKC